MEKITRIMFYILFIASILMCSCSSKDKVVFKEREYAQSVVNITMSLSRESALTHLAYLQTIKEIKKLFAGEDRDFPGIMGAQFYDIQSGYSCGIRDKEVFPAASVIKIPILVEVFQMTGKGTLNLRDAITLREEDKTGGSGIVRDMPAGKRYTIEELSRLMITKSDNTATDMLLQRVGMEAINCRMRELGLTHTVIQRKIFDFDALDIGLDNVTTPGDMKILLEYLYRGKGYGCFEMIEILKKQERRDMLPAFLPKRVKVAHKTGELLGVLLDVGIIYNDTRPYILCLMGKKIDDAEKARKIFARISGNIYDIMKESGKEH